MRYVVITLSALLTIAVGIIVILIRQQNIYISFEKQIAATPTLTADLTHAVILSPTSAANKMAKLGNKMIIPIKSSSGDTLHEVTYTLTEYEFTDEITVKGQTARTVAGRTFLIINIEIYNPSNNTIEINSKDYLRLSGKGFENEWLSPDIHNDPVEIQPISTKVTRLGFPINETDTELKLRFGEIDGQKEIISLEK